jgi:hypothetical protein
MQEYNCEQGGSEAHNGEGKQDETRTENLSESCHDGTSSPGTMIPAQCDSFVKLWKCLISKQDIAFLAGGDVEAGGEEFSADLGFGGVGAWLQDNTCR